MLYLYTIIYTVLYAYMYKHQCIILFYPSIFLAQYFILLCSVHFFCLFVLLSLSLSLSLLLISSVPVGFCARCGFSGFTNLVLKVRACLAIGLADLRSFPQNMALTSNLCKDFSGSVARDLTSGTQSCQAHCRKRPSCILPDGMQLPISFGGLFEVYEVYDTVAIF